MIRVLVADDQALVRAGFRVLVDSAPDLEVVAEAADGRAAVQAALDHRPDIVLMDIRMPGMDGLAASRQIRLFHPSARIVVVTDYDDEALRREAREAGACGYVVKMNLLDLAPLIRSIAEV